LPLVEPPEVELAPVLVPPVVPEPVAPVVPKPVAPEVPAAVAIVPLDVEWPEALAPVDAAFEAPVALTDDAELLPLELRVLPLVPELVPKPLVVAALVWHSFVDWSQVWPDGQSASVAQVKTSTEDVPTNWQPASVKPTPTQLARDKSMLANATLTAGPAKPFSHSYRARHLTSRVSTPAPTLTYPPWPCEMRARPETPMSPKAERLSLLIAGLSLAACGGGGNGGTTGGTCIAAGHSCSASSTCCAGLECSAVAGVCLVDQGSGNGNGNGDGAGSGSGNGNSSTATSGGNGATTGSSGTTTGTSATATGTTSGSHSASTTSGQASSSSSTSSGGACTAYGVGCADGGMCCSGLTCDETSSVCFVAAGYDCEGSEQHCAYPNMCNATSGVCGNGGCQPYGASCANGSCCTGLTCDTTHGDVCYVTYEDSCIGDAGVETCASPYVCQSNGYCGPASCVGYGQSCASGSCCTGYTCDSTQGDICYVSYGDACSGETCASPYTCQTNGTCGTSSGCVGYGQSCATGTCCTGYTCDTSTDYCYVSYGDYCGTTEYCADGYSCVSDYCTTGTSCTAYGGDCSGGETCCTNLTCDSSYEECLVAYGASCASGDACADGYTCDSANGYICD
jgi:hypothetical protein